jgi:catechol 2,3-dioxygenase-like lactoylglutathione lyase family enzyme
MRDLKLEVVVLHVSDLDRAKRFYEGLAWRTDADLFTGDGRRVVQLTPPGSECSIHLRQGTKDGGAPDPVGWLVVADIEAARADLLGRGAEVSGAFHFAPGGKVPAPGPDPEGRSYSTFASFSDPDGNAWLIQEIKARLPGRGLANDLATLAGLLREAEKRHGDYAPTGPKHHWSEWYSAYTLAREQGSTPEEAAKLAARHIEAAQP